MINQQLSFDLPLPWRDKKFEIFQLGAINFLVGPNGTGKSKFAGALKAHLRRNVRLLGTDRLSGMEQTDALRNIFGDHLQHGLAKNHFDHYKTAGKHGSGIDTIVLLEERMDLRIQVEATLSHLFNRKIILDWDSGHLIARAILGESGESYRLDREECHGIKELLVLLTHLYNDEYPYLIIDEPELNLHPQYQAFLMQEVRKFAGDPQTDKKKKIIFLITHSPFILDFRSVGDVQAVLSFNLDYSIPKQMLAANTGSTARLASLVPRLNIHHKQLFFSDNPIFVEGVFDAQLIGAMQEARGVSVVAAGSCIIDAGGCEEVNKYLELCLALGKSAYFLYDLDSLFCGNLRACLQNDNVVQSFLATVGVGNDFARYCGELDSKLTKLIDKFLAVPTVPQNLTSLAGFLKKGGPRIDWNKKFLSKARVAMLTAISRYQADVASITAQSDINDIEGRLKQIVAALKQKNINLLPGGTLERYLPLYTGDQYELTDDAKRQAVIAEIEEMAKLMSEAELSTRYGELYVAVCSLPSKINVDVDRVLRDYLSRYILDLQIAITNNPSWQVSQLQAHLHSVQRSTVKVFSIRELIRGPYKEFSVIVSIAEILGQKQRIVRVTHQTNPGMGDFKIEFA